RRAARWRPPIAAAANERRSVLKYRGKKGRGVSRRRPRSLKPEAGRLRDGSLHCRLPDVAFECGLLAMGDLGQCRALTVDLDGLEERLVHGDIEGGATGSRDTSSPYLHHSLLRPWLSSIAPISLIT